MSPHLCYVRGRTLLSQNGYDLTGSNEGFTLTKGTWSIIVTCRAFAAVFLNNMIRASGIEGSSPFPLFFSEDNAKSNIGILGVDYPLFTAEHPNLTGHALDKAIAKCFIRSDVYAPGDAVKLEQLNTAFPLKSLVPTMAHAVIDFDEECRPNINLGLLEDKAFYKAIDLSQFGRIKQGSPDLPAIWQRYVLKMRFFWRLEEKVLYLTNAFPGRYGLPPNHELLGLSLDLTLDNWRVSTDAKALVKVSQPARPDSTSERNKPGSSAVIEGDWLKLFTQFMNNPCLTTFNLLRCSVARSAFKSFKGSPEYDFGSSRKHKLTKKLVDKFGSEDKAGSFVSFAQSIREAAGDNVTVQFVTLMKLEGQARTSSAGGEDAGNIYLLTV